MAISKVPSSGITADFDNSLTTADLAPNSVDSSELVDGSIDTSHIGNLQVTAAKVASDVATTAGTQTFTNKTLTAPTLTTPALGTVATGNLSNTAIVYPAGHVVGSKVICDERLAAHIFTTSTSYVDTGLEISYITKRTSADSYLMYEMYYGIGSVPVGDSLYFDVTMVTVQNTTYVAGESIAASDFPFYLDDAGLTYQPFYLKLFCGLQSEMGMPATKSSWAVGDTLYFRLFYKNGGSVNSGFYNYGTLWYSVTEVER